MKEITKYFLSVFKSSTIFSTRRQLIIKLTRFFTSATKIKVI